jgi:short-subunit dehydrogenase
MNKVLITGASRGIGRSIALKLATKDNYLLLIARSKENLESLQKEIRSLGSDAEIFPYDLSTAESGVILSEKIREIHGEPEIIILNSAVSTDSEFISNSPIKIEYEMGVNYLAPVSFLHGMIPGMKKRKSGSIIFIGSIAGLLPFPGNSTYSATKATLFAFSNNLKLELQSSGVHVGIVLPGLTKTDMTKDFHSLILPFAEPEEVADSVIRCIKNKEDVVIPGILNNAVSTIYRFLPEPMNFFIGILADLVLPRSGRRQ